MTSSYILYYQADNILHESIISLRKENSQLQVEMNDLKQEVGLQLDQVWIRRCMISYIIMSSYIRHHEFMLSYIIMTSYIIMIYHYEIILL
jgi:hypothetical protein